MKYAIGAVNAGLFLTSSILLRRSQSSDVFTTSAEYLGEFMLILEKIIYVQALDQSTRDDVSECISAIKRSFGI